MADFDSVLESIGGFGRYQFLLMFPLMYYQVPGGLNSIAPVFISYIPDFRCLVYPFDNSTYFPNLTNSEIANITTPTDMEGRPENSCVRYSYPTTECADKMDLSCVNKSAATVSCNTYHFDNELFTKTTVTEFNLVCNRQLLDDISTSAYFVGILLSSIVSGYFLDRFGRKIPTIVHCFGMLLSMLFTAYSSSVTVFSISRLLVAFFTFGCHLGLYCSVLEVVGIRWTMLIGVLYHSMYCVGYMLWSAVAYVYRDWHEMQIACVVLSAPLVMMLTVVPESPRWHLAKGHIEKGKKIVNMIAKLNHSPLSSSSLINEETHATHAFEKKHQEVAVVKYSTLDLFRYPGLRISTLKLGFYSMISNTAYYALAYSMGNLSGNIFLNNIYSGLLEIAGNILCLVMVKYTGRPMLMSIAMGIVGILLLGSAVLSEVAGSNAGLSTLLVITMIFAKAVASGSQAVYCCYVVEFYPTFIRANGIGFTSTMCRLGSITSPFLIGIGAYSLRWLPDVILGVTSLVACVVAISLPDTANVPLRDTIEQAEIFIQRGRLRRKMRETYEEI